MSVSVPIIRQGYKIAATEDVAIKYEGRNVEWWKVPEERLPNWFSAVKKVLLVY